MSDSPAMVRGGKALSQGGVAAVRTCGCCVVCPDGCVACGDCCFPAGQPEAPTLTVDFTAVECYFTDPECTSLYPYKHGIRAVAELSYMGMSSNGKTVWEGYVDIEDWSDYSPTGCGIELTGEYTVSNRRITVEKDCETGLWSFFLDYYYSPYFVEIAGDCDGAQVLSPEPWVECFTYYDDGSQPARISAYYTLSIAVVGNYDCTGTFSTRAVAHIRGGNAGSTGDWELGLGESTGSIRSDGQYAWPNNEWVPWSLAYSGPGGTLTLTVGTGSCTWTPGAAIPNDAEVWKLKLDIYIAKLTGAQVGTQNVVLTIDGEDHPLDDMLVESDPDVNTTDSAFILPYQLGNQAWTIAGEIGLGWTGTIPPRSNLQAVLRLQQYEEN